MLKRRNLKLVFLVIMVFVTFALLFVVVRKSILKQTIAPIDRNKATNPAGNYDFTLRHDGLLRNYRVHIPSSYNKGSPMPAVIYLHGGGGSIDGAHNDGIDTYSEKYGFILLIPEGTGPQLPRRTLASWNSGEWYADNKLQSCCSYAYSNSVDDVGFISAMINKVSSDYSVDTNRIYATGISNGAMMSFALACNLSEHIAAVAPVASPATPKECAPARKVPIMYIHGTADPCAPYKGGAGDSCIGNETRIMQSASEIVDIWKNINSSSTDYRAAYSNKNASCVTFGASTNGEDVEFCTISNMGHAYPGGNQYLPTEKIGPVSYDMSFTQIWQFLENHAIN